MPGGSQLDAWRCLEGDRSMPWGVSSGVLWFLSATPNACAGSGECACARVCEVWIVADCCCCCGPVCSVCSAALACDARVLCACACWMRVRVCVCCARAAGVCCVLYSVVRLFVQLGGAALAGRAARWAAACCGWSCACLMVCGGCAARSTGPSAAQGASMPMRAACEAAARLARMFPCGEGRAYVFTLRARAGVEGGAVSPRSDAGWSSACRGRARRRPCRHRVAA
jgi:hypothetical protein